MHFQKVTISMIAIALLVVACGGTPDKNPLLEEAKNNFQKAENDTLIVSKAPVALKEAEEELEKSKQLWSDGADKELVSHHAYIAKQKVAIARETAELNAAQDEVKRAETQRQKVLIQARKAEAIAAEKRAQEALSEAKKERQRAQELAQQVDQLQAQQTERGLVLTLGDVLFDFDKATLKPGGQRAVSKLAQFMEEYPKRNVMIEGYTDNIGSDTYNRQLSRRRANSVQEALLDRGISSNRIQIRGYGEQYPVATNSTEAGRQRNRRVEVVISDKNGHIQERSS